MTITVGMPYYGCPDLVEKAVQSILYQSVTDLVCVVIGDGEEPPLANIRDSRVVLYCLPENHGAYFCQQLILKATPHAWYAPHAADDWSDADHLAKLAEYGTDVATGAVWYHNGDMTRVLRKLYEVGLYRVGRMLEIGGYNPAERIGQDSLTLKLMRLIQPMPATRVPTYHRVQRVGSLSTHPDTKRGSAARNAMRERNRAIVEKATALRHPDRIRAYRETLIPPAIAASLQHHVPQLRAML